MKNSARGSFSYPWFTVILLYLFGIGMMIFNAQYDILSHITQREVIRLGKMFGKVSLIFIVLLAVYYLLRAVYSRFKRSQVSITQAKLAPNILKILRQTHWLCGMLAVLFVMGHGYVLWYVAEKSNLKQIIPGFFAGGAFTMGMLVGCFIIFRPSHLNYRKIHRLLGVLSIMLLIIHLALA